MKLLKQTSAILILFVTISLSAQQGINYKALIKDNNGNIIANDLVQLQFSIRTTVNQADDVYVETHTPNTDANGIIIVNIGEGVSVSGSYASIDWQGSDHYLNVQVNTGGGLTDMGTTPFMAVPYALHAITANNVNGLEYLDENNDAISNGGHRIIGRNPVNYGNIGRDAVDLSYSNSASNTKGAAGINSTALGVNTIASGFASTAMEAATRAESLNSVAIGRYNIGRGSSLSLINTDPLFEVGNGTADDARSNAFTILKDSFIGLDQPNPITDFHIRQSQQTITNGTGGITFEESADAADTWRVYHSGIFLSFNKDANRVAYINSNGAWTVDSDIDLKKNISAFDSTLDKVLKLRPVKYHYKEQANNQQKTLGFIAQEIQSLFPEMVVTGEDGKLGVTYSTTGVIAIKAIQEQQQVINSLKAIIKEQNKIINTLKTQNEDANMRLQKVEQFIAQNE